MARLWILILLCTNAWAAGPTQAQLEKRLASDPDNVAFRTQLAEIHVAGRQFAKAAELLDPYTDQLTPAGFRALAFAYSNMKKYEDEVRVLNIIAAKEEQNHEWFLLLAHAYLKQAGDTQDLVRNGQLITKAIQSLRAVLRIQRKYKPAYDLLLKTLIQQKAHNEARELLTEGINNFGERPELYRELCRIDSNDGFLVQAVENCSKSISISPKYPDHYVYLIQALYDQKEEVRAERNAISAAKKFPSSEFVQWAAGTMFFRKKNYPVATRYYLTAVKAMPDSSRAQFGLAQALFESGRHQEALDHFTKACKLDRTTVETFLSSGGRLKQTGQPELGNKYVQAANTCR